MTASGAKRTFGRTENVIGILEAGRVFNALNALAGKSHAYSLHFFRVSTASRMVPTIPLMRYHVCARSALGTAFECDRTYKAVILRGVSAVEENIAGLLCYVGGWITGLVFFLIDKRPFVRFHAAQSIVVFGGLHIVYIILTTIFITSFWAGGFGFFSFAGLLFNAVRLAAVVLWIVLMVKAYQGEQFRVPIAANLADSFAAKFAK